METKQGFYRRLMPLVLPMAFQNLMTALVSASDAVMLGMLDQASLSAVSLAAQVQFVLNLFYAALTIGATVLAAQYWGRNDFKTVEQILTLVTRYACGVSVLFFTGAMACPNFLMRIFSPDSEIIRLGALYLRRVSWSYLCMGISQVYLCIMRNSGRTGRSSFYASTAVVVNILLNALLIFGLCGLPRMGVAGAAWATVFARLIELLLVIGENRTAQQIKFRFKELFLTNSSLQRDYWHYTTPVLLNEMVWGCGFTMFSVILGHMGVSGDAVAANSIANVAKNLIACFCMGVGGGSGILVGNLLGQGKLEEAKQTGGQLCRAALVTGAVSGLAILAVSPLIFMLAGRLTATAQGYLKGMLFICGYYMIGKSVNSTVIAGIFCAGGDTKFGMLCDFVTMWMIIIPVSALAAFVFRWPVLTVYFLLNLDEFVKLPAVYCHYKQYGWVRNITTQEDAA